MEEMMMGRSSLRVGSVIMCVTTMGLSLILPWITFYPVGGLNFQGNGRAGPPVVVGLLRCFNDVCDMIYKSRSFLGTDIQSELENSNIGRATIIVLMCMAITSGCALGSIGYTVLAPRRYRMQISLLILATSVQFLGAVIYTILTLEGLHGVSYHLGYWICLLGGGLSLFMAVYHAILENNEHRIRNSKFYEPMTKGPNYGTTESTEM